jgi:hypothetical protein
MKVRIVLLSVCLFGVNFLQVSSQNSKVKITDYYFQVGSANYDILRLPYVRFSSAFPENEYLQRDDLTTWPTRINRRTGFLINNVEMGIGYQSSKSPHWKFYSGIQYFNTSHLSTFGINLKEELFDTITFSNNQQYALYTVSNEYVAVSPSFGQLMLNTTALYSANNGKTFDIEYGFGLSLGYTVASWTNVFYGIQQRPTIYDHPELGFETPNPEWMFMGNIEGDFEKYNNRLRIFTAITSANLGLIFRPNPKGRLNFYYRFSPMVIHSVSADLGYTFSSGYNNLFGMRIRLNMPKV